MKRALLGLALMAVAADPAAAGFGLGKSAAKKSSDNTHPGCGTDVYNTPAIGADGTVLAYSEFNFLYAFNPDGSVKWKTNALLPSGGGGSESSAAIMPNGTLYVGKHSSMIAVQTGILGLSPTAQWPKYGNEISNSGRQRP